jgi:hypothetical protein
MKTVPRVAFPHLIRQGVADFSAQRSKGRLFVHRARLVCQSQTRPFITAEFTEDRHRTLHIAPHDGRGREDHGSRVGKGL